MNYGQVKNESLKMINKYSIAGTAVPASYNSQADYLARIPGLVDAALFYVATTAKHLPTRVAFSSLSKTQYGNSYLVELPTNCWQLSGAGLMLFNSSSLSEVPFERYHGYKTADRKTFVIPQAFADANSANLMVEYFRYPAELGSAPADTAELDCPPEVKRIIPYYVAAHLLMFDDFSLYVSLINEFETRLSRLGEVAQAEKWSVTDSYGLGGMRDVY